MNTEHTEYSDRRAVLIARVIDGVATSEDWRELRERSDDEQAVWTELAEQQELHRRVSSVVDAAGDVAEGVELPMHLHARTSPMHRLRVTRAIGGWAVAAMVALAWSMGVHPGDAVVSGDPGEAQANLAPATITSAGEALKRYLDLGMESGQVVGEVPENMVLDSRPLPEGGYEVLYVRPIIERTVVHSVYRQVRDDTGGVHVIRVEEPANTTPNPRTW